MSAATDIDFRLNGLLADWYAWRRRYTIGRGYSSRDSTCRDYHAPGHWDSRNGAEDARGEELQMKAMDAAVERVPNAPERWNTALQFEAMNLHSGCAVWTSPMLPKNPAELEVLVLEARNRLMRELRKDGLFDLKEEVER